MSSCWCIWPRVATGTMGPRAASQNEQELLRQTARGEGLGLLAYRAGEPVGWCSVGPQDAFERFARVAEDRVWLIACIFVAGAERGSGIGGALLEAAVDEAARHGALAVEGPPTGWFPGDDRAGFDATLRMFRRAGFTSSEKAGAAGLMRRTLGAGGRPMLGEVPTTLDLIRWIDAFHAGTRLRLVAAAAAVAPGELYRPRVIAGGNEDGSLFATLAHLVGGEAIWLARWRGEVYAPLPGVSDFADLAAVVGAWESTENGRREFLLSLRSDDLQRQVRYLSVTKGVMEQFPLWKTLLHVANHTTHHRAEACAALTALGHPPTSVDLIDFMREQAPDDAGRNG